MPNPLSQVDPGNKLKLDEARPWVPRSTAVTNPITQIFAIWSDIDATLAHLLAYSVSGNHETIIAMYGSLRSDDAKLGALYAAAKVSLSPSDYCLMRAVIESCKPARTQRNVFAHHIYHNLIGRDDLVVITDPSVHWNRTAQMEHAYRAVGTGEPILPIPELDRRKMIAYDVRDLESCLEQAQTAHSNVNRIPFCIDGHPSAAHMRPELLVQPRVQKLFEKLLGEHTP